MEKIDRPLNFLACRKAENKKVIVTTKSGKEYFGILIAFDIHINLVIAEEKEGKLFIRGDEVCTIA